MAHSFIELCKPLHHNKAVLWSSSGPYGCGSWIIKIECQIIYAFELPCWRRLLKVSLTARRVNLSILREINSENSLEGLMLKLELQYFGHLTQTDDKPSQHIQKQRHYFANKGPSSQSYILSSSCMDLRVEPERKLSAKELILLKCGVGKTLESPKRSNQALLKETNPEHTMEGLMLRLKLQYLGHLM